MQTDFSDNTRKGQSAIEYLTTYGWALLAIVIVGAVLMQMGVFSQCSTTTPRSSGQSLAIADWQYNSNDQVTIEFEAIDQNVNVTGITLQYDTWATQTSFNGQAGVDIPAGTSQTITVDDDGNGLGLSSGSCGSAAVNVTADVGDIPGSQIAFDGTMTGPVP